MLCTAAPNVIWIMKSKRMRWVGQAAYMVDRRSVYRVWWGELMERDYLEDMGVDGNIILKRIFKKWNGETWTGLLWLRIGTGGGRL